MAFFIVLLFIILIALYSRISGIQRKLTDELEALRKRTAFLENKLSETSVSARVDTNIPPPAAQPLEQNEAEPAPSPPPRLIEPPTGPIVIPPSVTDHNPPDSSNLAEKLGTMGFVWIGATALALAGIFLVKYSFEHGWISPTIRITIAIFFGAILLVAGEWMRMRSARISEGLSAAGIADLYASFLAAFHLYHLIPAIVAFALMALTTVVAVLLSLRQGQFVAVLGLMGGFFTPSWIHTGHPSAPSLFSYLMILQIGLLLVSHKKRWNVLMVLTLTGSMIWLALWFVFFFQQPDSLALSVFLIATVALFVWRNYSEDQAKTLEPLSFASIFAGAAMMATLTGIGGYQTSEWIFLAMLSAASLILAGRQPRYFLLACSTLVSTALLLIVWSFSPALSLSRFRITVLLEILLFAGAGYYLIWKSKQDSRWAAFSVAAAVLLFLIGYSAEMSDTAFHWSIPSILLATGYLAGAHRVTDMPERLTSPNSTLAALAVGVTAFVSLAIPLELQRQAMIIPFALEIAALTAISRRLKIPVLDNLAAILCMIVLALLLIRLGDHPSWKWILYTYGISAAAIAAAARFSTRKDHSHAYQWCSILLFFLLITLETGQIHHSGSFRFARSWLETGTIAAAWLAFSLLLLQAGAKWKLAIPARAAKAIAFLAAGEILLFGCVVMNPLFFNIPVGGLRLLNFLLYVYGLPALLLLFLSRHPELKGTKTALLLRGCSLLLFFLLMNFQIRRFFHGPYLSRGAASTTEQYIYSASWVIFGIVLTIVAVLRRGLLLRYASLAVLLMAACKVFIYDSENLTDLYRVFSFLGLGMSLLGIAYLYQKVLFRIPKSE